MIVFLFCFLIVFNSLKIIYFLFHIIFLLFCFNIVSVNYDIIRAEGVKKSDS